MDPSRIGLRESTEADYEYCFWIKHLALGDYVRQVWGWDDAYQRSLHRMDFDLAKPYIITIDHEDLGTCEIVRGSHFIHIGEFFIHPDRQRQGIGTIVLSRLIEEAAIAGLPLRLEVMKINPARSLYERHGFRVTGEREHHFLMEK